MTSYGSSLYGKNVTCDDLTSKVIHWTEFEPKLQGGDPSNPTPGLALVLGASNDAGTESIQDVSKLTFEFS